MRSELAHALEELRSNEAVAIAVTRTDRWLLLSIAAALSVGGLIIANWQDNYTWFARSGAAISVCAFAMAALSLRMQRAWQIVSIVLADEKQAREWASLEPFALAIQRRLTAEQVGVAAVGTLIWGFGDLLRYVL